MKKSTSTAVSQVSPAARAGIKALAIAALALATGQVWAQTWTKQSAIPTPRSLSAVAFTSVMRGFVVGEAGTLLETLNGGVTWQAVDLGVGSDPFYGVAFRDSQNGFVIGNTGSTSNNFRTTNGGATWFRFTLPAGSWREIDFVNLTTGFVGANGVVCRTTDGGNTWDVRSAYPQAPIVYGMDFKDANTGLVGGYSIATQEGGLFKTTDGGTTWTLKLVGFINDPLWLDANVALACGDTSIYRTTNAGETWSLYASGIRLGPSGAGQGQSHDCLRRVGQGRHLAERGRRPVLDYGVRRPR